MSDGSETAGHVPPAPASIEGPRVADRLDHASHETGSARVVAPEAVVAPCDRQPAQQAGIGRVENRALLWILRCDFHEPAAYPADDHRIVRSEERRVGKEVT